MSSLRSTETLSGSQGVKDILSSDWCVLSAEADLRPEFAQISLVTPAYPTSKRHANQGVGS